METPKIDYELLLQSLIKGTESFPAGKVLKGWINAALNEQGFEIVNNEIVAQKKDCKIKAGNWYTCIKSVLYTGTLQFMFEVGKKYLSEEDGHLSGNAYLTGETKNIDVSSNDDCFSLVFEDKRAEQLKFCPGDWIVGPNQETYLVYEVCDDNTVDAKPYYCLETTNNEKITHFAKYVDSEFRRWTINDANPGDVLMDMYGNIGIFDKISNTKWYSFVYYNPMKEYGLSLGGRSHCMSNVVPAVYNQKKMLLDKLQSEGYAFDFVNKKLVKKEMIGSDGSESNCIDEAKSLICNVIFNQLTMSLNEQQKLLNNALEKLKNIKS